MQQMAAGRSALNRQNAPVPARGTADLLQITKALLVGLTRPVIDIAAGQDPAEGQILPLGMSLGGPTLIDLEFELFS
jgi:hypothetical protein